MTADVDDEALSWGGELDPTHVDAPVAAPGTAAGDAPDDRAAADVDGTRTGSALLVAYGVFAGILLLYSVGWIIAVQRNTFADPNLLANALYKVGELLAILAPVVWFFSVLFLTRGRRSWVRVVWILLGVLLLAPWPFILAL
jgi:hypothetical protein